MIFKRELSRIVLRSLGDPGFPKVDRTEDGNGTSYKTLQIDSLDDKWIHPLIISIYDIIDSDLSAHSICSLSARSTKSDMITLISGCKG